MQVIKLQGINHKDNNINGEEGEKINFILDFVKSVQDLLIKRIRVLSQSNIQWFENRKSIKKQKMEKR